MLERQRGVVAAVALAVVLGACAPSSRPSAPPAGVLAPERASAAREVLSGQQAAPPAGPAAAALQALVDGARQEGQLNLVLTAGVFGGDEGLQYLMEGFNRLYGLNLTVRTTPGPTLPNMVARLVDEYKADRVATTDMAVGWGDHILALSRADVLEPVDWLSWAGNVPGPGYLAPGGAAVAVASGLPGIAYSPERLSGDRVPHSLQDLLKPEYQGRIAATEHAGWFNHLAAPELWGEQRTLDYVRRLSHQAAGLIRCSENERIVSGEFDAYALTCVHNNILRMKADGAPIDFTIATDAPLIGLFYAGVPRRAAHPNAAKLFINYLLSREAQDAVYAMEARDLHLLPGSKTARDIEQWQTGGIRFTLVDVDFYQRNDEKELNRLAGELVAALQNP
ncbi:MAG TPA: extracellular solute-binding protein [Chloroflexota bacterium]|jgi:iron(III) transport system substrate-binding protein